MIPEVSGTPASFAIALRRITRELSLGFGAEADNVSANETADWSAAVGATVGNIVGKLLGKGGRAVGDGVGAGAGQKSLRQTPMDVSQVVDPQQEIFPDPQLEHVAEQTIMREVIIY